MKAYKFKLKVSKTIKRKLEETLSVCCEIYNAALQERRDAWQLNRISINYHAQSAQLPEIKLIRDDVNGIYSQILQDVLRRVSKTFDAFFARVMRGDKAGFPRFKSVSRFDSFCFPQSGFKLVGDKLTLSKIGSLKLRLSRTIEGRVKTCTIKREASGWFVIFTAEDAPKLLPKTGKQIGLDVGIESFVTLSDGSAIDNFKYYETSVKQLRRAQRRVSRRKKGSKGRIKAIVFLQKIHEKIHRQRTDFQHKISTNLVKEFDLIAVEALNIKGMSRGILSKQIYDVAWRSFFSKLKYKAENAGRELIEVNPSGTSQTCVCGATVKKDLSVRWHCCKVCGLSEHRDSVSAKIILSRAGQTRKDVTYALTQSVFLESPTHSLQA
jgi:putative transposase